MGPATGPPGPGRRGRLGHHQRHGRVDRDRAPVRRHRLAAGDHAVATRWLRRDVQFGLISICAQGGMGFAMVLERICMTAFTVERRGGVAIVTFDTPHDAGQQDQQGDRAGNSRSCCSDSTPTRSVKAIVLRSGKPDNFIAGADIEEFVALRSVEEASRLSRDGQLLMQRVADSAKPVVAAIHGACLGGGLELSLACRVSRRERSSQDRARLSRGPARRDSRRRRLEPTAAPDRRARAALDMILTARHERGQEGVRARPGRRAGSRIDPARRRDRRRRAALPRRPASRRRGGAVPAIDRNPLGRAIVFRKARGQMGEEDRRPLSRRRFAPSKWSAPGSSTA